jgi:1-acyl-sn-glycerol-3-phosphate acyltransferase
VRPGKHRRWFGAVAGLVKPFLWTFTRHDWRGMENIPSQGGVLVVANHVTVVDPITLAHAMYDGAHRIPCFLAKAELFSVPVVGGILRRSGQIPVYRRSRDAANSLRAAEEALAAGECVIIYPEGTCTRDPDSWPMVARTGVARLALSADVPVVPLAHWGAQRLLGYHSKRPHLFPPKRVYANAGPAVDLSAYKGVEPTNEVLRRVTDLLMHRVAELLGELRGEPAPAVFYQAREATGASAAPRPAIPADHDADDQDAG